MNEREDKQYSDPEESEYHYSEDEVSYEVEPETPPPEKPKPKGNFLSRLSGSKRMLITILVFFVLVFIVYRMLSPTDQTPPTDITPVASAPVQPREMPPQTVAPPQTPPVVPTQPTAPLAPQPITPVARPAQPEVMPVPEQPTVQPIAGMPNVIPVPAQPAPLSPTTEVSQLSTIAAQNQQAISQLESQYNARINDFMAQNKVTQEQLQALSTKVQEMENQLHQLVETLTRQSQTVTREREPTVIRREEQAAPEMRSNYTVQAIIPGRAWLKGADGETLTVAEGDNIRGLGRVTKIDPYDGVVEVTNGNRTISISYGAGN